MRKTFGVLAVVAIVAIIITGCGAAGAGYGGMTHERHQTGIESQSID